MKVMWVPIRFLASEDLEVNFSIESFGSINLEVNHHPKNEGVPFG